MADSTSLRKGGRVCRPRRADVAQDRSKRIDDDLDDDDAASPWSHLFAEKSDYTLLRKVPLWLCHGSDLGARSIRFAFAGSGPLLVDDLWVVK
jgi:hypothetical protein